MKALQRRLNNLGYSPGPVDGRYGPLTEDAVIGFQATHDLRVDGIAGPMTLAALGSLGMPGVMRFGCRGTDGCCLGYDDDVAAPVPAVTGSLSVFSRRDGVADWRACIDPDGRNVEVDATHCGMPCDPAARRAILEALERFESAPHAEPVGLPLAA